MTSLISGVRWPAERLLLEQPLIAVFDFQLEVVNYRLPIEIDRALLHPTYQLVTELLPALHACY